MRICFITCWLIALFSAIAILFWQNELKYNMPTPVPSNYHPVAQGATIYLDDKIGVHNNQPVFLHFFNPDCPCSRFNITHFKSLVKQYGTKINFIVVAITKDSSYTAKAIQNKFDLSIPVLFDQSIADACGVYSTPQAALIGADHRLYYRGNYNRSRYCSDEKSNYAQMAIDSLLNHSNNLHFGELATRSYGCRLPGCNK